MSYTFAVKTPVAEPNELNNFSNVVVDGAHTPIGAGAGPQTTDATGTPQKSPLTVADNAVTTLLVPTNASKVSFITATNTLNVCEVSSAMANYVTIPTGVTVTIDVARCSTLYLESNTGNATVSFWFTVI